MGCRIIAAGAFLPEKVIMNEEFTKTLDTSDEWIRSRTGIEQRHVVEPGQPCSFLAIEAAKQAIANASIEAGAIDLVIVATTTPDHSFPSVATKVQAELLRPGTPAFDIQAVCAGFVYALPLARSLIVTRAYKNILVIGAEVMSSLLDYNDRSTCILFGDGAGAVIVSADDTESDIIASTLYSDGRYSDILYTDGGVSTTQTAGKIIMNGPEVYKRAIEGMYQACVDSLKQAEMSIDDIDYLIPHQANMRIINAVGKKLQIDDNNVIKTVAKHANCSAASIPLAISENFAKFKQGDIILCCAFGAGLSWGANLIRW